MTYRRARWEFRNNPNCSFNATGTFTSTQKKEFGQIMMQKAESAVREAIRKDEFWRLRTKDGNGKESKVSYIFDGIGGREFGPMGEEDIKAKIFRVVFHYEKDKTFCEAISLTYLLGQYSQEISDFREMGADGKRDVIVAEIKQWGTRTTRTVDGVEISCHTPLHLIDDGALPTIARHILWRHGRLRQNRTEKICGIREAISFAKDRVTEAIEGGIAQAINIDGLLGILLDKEDRAEQGDSNPFYRMREAMLGGGGDPARNAQDMMYLIAKLRNYAEFNSELMWIWEKLG